MECDEYDIWPNTVELCFGRVRILKVKALDYLKRFDVVVSTLEQLLDVPDDSQTVYWVTFKTSEAHSAFLSRHGPERVVKLGDSDVKVACNDKSLHYRDVLLSKIPPNFNLEVIKMVLKTYGKVNRIDWEVYADRAMGELVGCKTGFIKIRMVIDQHIPSYVNVGPYRCYVTYKGQPITCRHCDARGHTWIGCPKRRFRRGPAGQEQFKIPQTPPRVNPPAAQRKAENPPPAQVPPRHHGRPSAPEQMAWSEVVSSKRRSNTESSVEESAPKAVRSDSVHEPIAQAANAAPATEEGVSSNPEDAPMANDFPPLVNTFSNADVEKVTTQGSVATTHVSETQTSHGVAELNGGDTTNANALTTPREQPSGYSTDIGIRPQFPDLSSVRFSHLPNDFGL